MSNFQPDQTLNLAGPPYRHTVQDMRPHFMPFQTSSEMSPHAAMAAALAAAQSSAADAAAADGPTHADFARASVSSLDPTSDHISMRLPNLDLSMHRQQRPMQQAYSINPSLPFPNSLPPVQSTANFSPHTSSQLTAIPSSYSHSLPISQLTSDPVSYAARPSAIPPIAYPAVSASSVVSKPSDHGIIPAAAQLIDTTAVRGRSRSLNGAVKKKGTTTRRKKARTGPANYICALAGCGKAFRMQGDLQTHMRKHTGDEPFACSFPDCNMRYKWRSSLSHHEGLHRKAKDFRLKPRRRRRSTAAVLSIPAEQLMVNQNGTYTDPQTGIVSAAQTSFIPTPGQTTLVTSATQTTLMGTAGQAGLVSAAPLGRLP